MRVLNLAHTNVLEVHAETDLYGEGSPDGHHQSLISLIICSVVRNLVHTIDEGSSDNFLRVNPCNCLDGCSVGVAGVAFKVFQLTNVAATAATTSACVSASI